MAHHVYLIPGFFGFANIGELKYFAHVREQLDAVFERAGTAVDIHYVATLPTASLARRALRLANTIAATAGDGDQPIHLIGHSTGGLDARLVVSPGVTLRTDHDFERLAARVRSVVSVASPHHGAPLASLFTSVLGQRLLRVLSLATVHTIRLGSVPLPAALAVAGVLPRMSRREGPMLRILDQAYRLILKDFDRGRRDDIEEFFAEAAADQALMPQLAPETMDVFNAATTCRPGTRYGCVVTQARPPELRGHWQLGLSPSSHALYGLYRGLYRLAGGLPKSAGPGLDSSQVAVLWRAFDVMPDGAANDGIVPTLSQIFGEVIHAAWADHLDVVGHFEDSSRQPPHVDWITTRSQFARPGFERLWHQVGEFLLSAGDR